MNTFDATASTHVSQLQSALQILSEKNKILECDLDAVTSDLRYEKERRDAAEAREESERVRALLAMEFVQLSEILMDDESFFDR